MIPVFALSVDRCVFDHDELDLWLDAAPLCKCREVVVRPVEGYFLLFDFVITGVFVFAIPSVYFFFELVIDSRSERKRLFFLVTCLMPD